MVRLVLIRSRRNACCCRVLVVNGACGRSCRSFCSTFVTTNGKAEPDPEELRDFVRERIARFKAPKRIDIVDELPKTGTGKIQKFMLREKAAEQSKEAAKA